MLKPKPGINPPAMEEQKEWSSTLGVYCLRVQGFGFYGLGVQDFRVVQSCNVPLAVNGTPPLPPRNFRVLNQKLFEGSELNPNSASISISTRIRTRISISISISIGITIVLVFVVVLVLVLAFVFV